MSREKLRRQITTEAARLMATGRETDLFRARRAASRRICRGWLRPDEMPSDAEIRDEIERCAYLYEVDARFDNLRDMRLAALAVMRVLRRFRPRLVGNVLAGDVRRAGDIRLQLFANSVRSVCEQLEAADIDFEPGDAADDVPHPRGTRIRARVDSMEFDLRCYPADKARLAYRNRNTGEPVPRATRLQLEALIAREYPDVRLDDLSAAVERADRFEVYRMLLLPLRDIEQPRRTHPEGDALYHSLQVFHLVREENSWDEELLLAALLHDVGKAIDPIDHVTAGLAALEGYITERTAWLIGQHPSARRMLEGGLGERARRRLQQHEDYDALLTLARADRAGRIPGGPAPSLDEAIEYIRELARTCG